MIGKYSTIGIDAIDPNISIVQIIMNGKSYAMFFVPVDKRRKNEILPGRRR